MSELISRFQNLSPQRKMATIAAILVILAIPFTVLVALQQQSDVQRAAGNKTTLGLTLGVDGVGSVGSQGLRNSWDSNKNPRKTKKNVTVQLRDNSGKIVDTAVGQLAFDPLSGLFKGSVGLAPNVSSGKYKVYVKTKGQAAASYKSLWTIVAGTSNNNQPGEISLQTGDINDDGVIDKKDYQILVSCSNHSEDNHTLCNSNPDYVLNSDLNSDGSVDLVDLVILLREMVQGRNPAPTPK